MAASADAAGAGARHGTGGRQGDRRETPPPPLPGPERPTGPPPAFDATLLEAERAQRQPDPVLQPDWRLPAEDPPGRQRIDVAR